VAPPSPKPAWVTGRVSKITSEHKAEKLRVLAYVDGGKVPIAFDSYPKGLATQCELSVFVVNHGNFCYPLNDSPVTITPTGQIRLANAPLPRMACRVSDVSIDGAVLRLRVLELNKPVSVIGYVGRVPREGEHVSFDLSREDTNEFVVVNFRREAYMVPNRFGSGVKDKVKHIFTTAIFAQPGHEGVVGDCDGELKASLGLNDHGGAGGPIRELEKAGFIEPVLGSDGQQKRRLPPPDIARRNHNRSQPVWRVLKIW